MESQQELAQEMRREVKGLCYQCGDQLPVSISRRIQRNETPAWWGREEYGLCGACYAEYGTVRGREMYGLCD